MLQRITSLLLHWRFLFLPDCCWCWWHNPSSFAIAHRAFYPYDAQCAGWHVGAWVQSENTSGAILNETGDVISDIALYLPFLLLPESNASLVILMLFCTILTEFCGLLAQTINGIRSYVGPFGKSDRALIFGLWGLAIAIYPQWMQWNNLLWSIASILLLWTAINRCRSVLLMSAER